MKPQKKTETAVLFNKEKQEFHNYLVDFNIYEIEAKAGASYIVLCTYNEMQCFKITWDRRGFTYLWLEAMSEEDIYKSFNIVDELTSEEFIPILNMVEKLRPEDYTEFVDLIMMSI